MMSQVGTDGGQLKPFPETHFLSLQSYHLFRTDGTSLSAYCRLDAKHLLFCNPAKCLNADCGACYTGNQHPKANVAANLYLGYRSLKVPDAASADPRKASKVISFGTRARTGSIELFLRATKIEGPRKN